MLPADPILGLMALYRADTNPRKVDLGVGVYRNAAGETPVLQSVREAEAEVLRTQRTKTYVGPLGNPDFNVRISQLALSTEAGALADRRQAILQTPGGCGALRLLAELIRSSRTDAVVWVSDPTWGNHVPLLGNAGLQLRSYPYLDQKTLRLRFDDMLNTLSDAAAGDIVLLHASCHNPTGVDLSAEQWRTLATLLLERQLVPFVDMAYQGFGSSLDDDAYGLRLLSEQLPETLFSLSCSKNFGLYRERVGVAGVICTNARAAQAVQSHMAAIARGIWSMPPDHGAAIVAHILGDERLMAGWQRELQAMRDRIAGLRRSFSNNMRQALPGNRFDFIQEQSGMFSCLGISSAQVQRLAKAYGVYMLDNSRSNIAGFNDENLAYVCQSLAELLADA